ncbi:MAG: cytochrome c [Herbaspirillum sp.]
MQIKLITDRALVLGAVIVAGFVAAFLIAAPVFAANSSYTEIQRGRYLVNAGDCAACHTNRKDQPFAGGFPVPTPFGVIYSTNITPDKDTGIGKWTQQDFYNAMHHGVRRNGEHLYPAFPYPWFTKMTRTDVNAIKAYLDTVQPLQVQNKPLGLPWPLNWRGAMVVWNTLFFKPGKFVPQPDKSAVWNRGAYLVEGAGHCAACHTPKNLFGGTKSGLNLVGGDAGEHWFAPSLTSNQRAGLGSWSKAEIIDYLKTGSNARTAAAGSMADVIRDSTQHLNDADLDAIATYLKDVPNAGTNRSKSVETVPVTASATVVGVSDNQSTVGNKPRNITSTNSTVSQTVMEHGAGLYLDNCAGCHMQNGKGQAHIFPSIVGSSVLQASKPDTVVHLILTGFKRPATTSKPTEFAMPAFNTKLSDAEIADLVSYVRNAWGNQAAAISASAVAKIRDDLKLDTNQ